MIPAINAIIAAYRRPVSSGGGGGAIAWNELTQGASLTNGATTSSITPTANATVFLTLVMAETGSSVPGTLGVTVEGCNLTWTEIDRQGYGSRRIVIVLRGTSASPTTEGITITFFNMATSFAEVLWSVDEATNTNATPVGTPQKAEAAGATSLACPDVGTIDAGDYVFAAFARTTAAASTADTGTVLSAITTGADTRSLLAFYTDTDDTPSVTWSGSDEGAIIGFIVEKQ